MTLNDPNPDFKVTSLYDADYLRNGTRETVTTVYVPYSRVSFRITLS